MMGSYNTHGYCIEKESSRCSSFFFFLLPLMIYMSPEGCFKEGEGSGQDLEKKNRYLMTLSSRPFHDPALKAPVDMRDLKCARP